MNELAVGAVVNYQYDYALVALSFIISVLGSYVALALVAARDKGQDRVLAPAVALGGCGIWSMHFIGMIAYKTQLPVAFSFVSTLLSLLLAIGFTAVGFRIALKDPKKIGNLVQGGAVIGAGVVGMHYLGMIGMNMRADIEWHWGIVAASVAIAVVAATVALWLAFNVRTTVQRITAALTMGVAVCAMHYTGMAAATMICVSNTNYSIYSLSGPYLGSMVFGLSVVLLGFSSVMSKVGARAA